MPAYSSESIRELRDRYRVSHAVLATILNTSLSTVRQWEIGEKRPSGPSVKLLNLPDRKEPQAFRLSRSMRNWRHADRDAVVG
jgi:putative transcriptional regulator